MWKYLVTLLVVLLSLGGLVAAQDPCVDCYSNQINQNDIQVIDTVRLAIEDPDNIKETVAVGNEGLSAAIIVAKAPVEPTAQDQFFVAAPFAKIDQFMNQRLTNLGPRAGVAGDGAKGITWNKAIQAAWIANQGVKELEGEGEDATYVKEGAWIVQSTTQLTDNVLDYDSREAGKVLNVDNKLAMIVDDMNAVFNLQANADSSSTDSQASNGNVTNNVNVTIAGKDP